MPDAPTAEMLKRMKVDAPVSSTFAQPSPPETNGSSSKGKSRATTVQDEEEEEEMDVELSEDFAPGNDADYFAEEDQEGRFFGGGLTSEQKEILNIFDKAGGEGTLDDDVSIGLVRPACLTMLSIDADRMKALPLREYAECCCDSSALQTKTRTNGPNTQMTLQSMLHSHSLSFPGS